METTSVNIYSIRRNKHRKWWQKIIGERLTLSGLMSTFIMGSGQVRNKQYLKGIFFFAVQFIYILIEILTSSIVIPLEPGEPKTRGYGFFRRGLWGIITLGENEGGRYPDNSSLLMIQGLIAIILLAVLAFIWIYNIRDANETYVMYKDYGIKITTKQYLDELMERSFAYALIFPISILILLVSIMPILYGMLIAFTNYDAYHRVPANLLDWVGFSNFIKVFKHESWKTTFLGVTVWTFVWAFLATGTTFFGGLFLAVVVNNRRVKFKRFWRTILILPWAIPSMISLLVFRNFFNQTYGPLNQMLNANIPWLNDPTLAKVTLLVVNFWLGVPYFMMLMSGMLTSFDKSLYEAAKIDGANNTQIFWRITFPILMTQVFPLLVMSFAHNFNNFGGVFFLTDGGPRNINYEYAGHTDLLISWIYKMTVDFKMYNMASVMSFIIFLIIGTISAFNLVRTKAFREEL